MQKKELSGTEIFHKMQGYVKHDGYCYNYASAQYLATNDVFYEALKNFKRTGSDKIDGLIWELQNSVKSIRDEYNKNSKVNEARVNRHLDKIGFVISLFIMYNDSESVVPTWSSFVYHFPLFDILKIGYTDNYFDKDDNKKPIIFADGIYCDIGTYDKTTNNFTSKRAKYRSFDPKYKWKDCFNKEGKKNDKYNFFTLVHSQESRVNNDVIRNIENQITINANKNLSGCKERFTDQDRIKKGGDIYELKKVVKTAKTLDENIAERNAKLEQQRKIYMAQLMYMQRMQMYRYNLMMQQRRNLAMFNNMNIMQNNIIRNNLRYNNINIQNRMNMSNFQNINFNNRCNFNSMNNFRVNQNNLNINNHNNFNKTF